MRLSLVSAALGLIAACSLPALAQTTGHAGAGSHAVDSQTKVDAIAGAVFDNLVEVTDMHFHKGEYNHIVNLSRMIVGARPQNVEVYADAAWLLWSMNRDAEAVALNQQGAEANPHTYFMFDELGQYYTRKRDWPHAVEYYEKAAACSDCPDMTVHGLAHAYEKNGQLAKSLNTWKRAVTMKGDLTGSALRNLERVKRLMEREDPPKQ